MKKIHKNLLIYFITLFFLVEFLINSNSLINIFFNTINLCFNNLFPNIFIFFTITDILNNYDFPYYLSKILGRLFEKIYKLPQICSYILIMSTTSGFPGNAKLIKEQLDNGSIDSYDGTKILTMTHFSNPLFILYAVGNNYFHDNKIGVTILISHFITNFIIGFLMRNIYPYKKRENKYLAKKPLSFINLLKQSFYNTSKILINIFGIIIFFSLLITILNKYLNLNPFSHMILNGLIEITTGLKYLSILKIAKIKAAMLATFFISFGGFSIHLQTISILNNYKINYYIYLIARILHGTISALITLIILTYYK